MIISLEDAQVINPNVSQIELDGFENAIRQETNNHFQNLSVRFHQINFLSENKIVVLDNVEGLRIGDTVQISNSRLNDGLYVIEAIEGNEITFKFEPEFFPGAIRSAFLTKVEYPADIVAGVQKLLQYDAKMEDKVGLKSKTVARMSETYFDQNSTETVAGYPAAMMSFIDKYRRMRW